MIGDLSRNSIFVTRKYQCPKKIRVQRLRMWLSSRVLHEALDLMSIQKEKKKKKEGLEGGGGGRKEEENKEKEGRRM